MAISLFVLKGRFIDMQESSRIVYIWFVLIFDNKGRDFESECNDQRDLYSLKRSS